MRHVETVLGVLAGLAALATFGLAIVVSGSLVASLLAERETRSSLVAISVVEPAASTADADRAPVVTAASASEQAVTVADGEKVFKKCQACHTVDEGGASKSGPNLWNIVGRNVAALNEFNYSDEMVALGGTWDVDLLDRYLAAPKDVVPRTLMAFVGLRKESDRQAVILYLAQLSATPASASDLGFAPVASPVAGAAEAAAEAAVEIEEVPYPEGVTYANPPERSAEDTARIAELVAELEALTPTLDYERARHHPLHFPPVIETASNEECLVCHQEILTAEPRAASPAGVPAAETIAWYQTLDTYFGEQQSFHYRHLESDYAKAVMNLECTFCHKGNDPREESPDMMPGRDAYTAPASPEFTLRKMVNPSETCLLCHGAMSDPEGIMGLAAPWHEARLDFEYEEAPNGCLGCHAEAFRTERHNVTYLNAANIEEIGRWGSSDSCYGCHGGRAWYGIAYPYPRHAWPDMDPEIPDWAVGRPTASDPRYALPATAQ